MSFDFNYRLNILRLTFVNSSILLFDSNPDQRVYFSYKSASFEINKKGFNNLGLLKIDKESMKDSDCLFIPLEAINIFRISEFKTTCSSLELDEQLFNLNHEGGMKSSGFIIPIKNLEWTFFYDKDTLLNQLKENKSTAVEIFRSRTVHLPIRFIDDLMKIAQLFPANASHINYSFCNQFEKSILRNTNFEIMNDLSLIKPKFSKIEIYHKLSPEEFNIICELLSLNWVRFNISKIYIELNLLSECLTLLSLCANCPELKSIGLKYFESDKEITIEDIESSIKDFKRKFGFIQDLGIFKSKN